MLTEIYEEVKHYPTWIKRDDWKRWWICKMEVNISVEYDYMTVLKPFGVGAFVPGPWIQDFLECYELFKAEEQRREIEKKYDSEKVSDLKKRYGLD